MKAFRLVLKIAVVVFMISLPGLAAYQPRSTVHRQGDLLIKQPVAPGFDGLPLNRKLYAYYMAQAIEAGRDIIWIQSSRHGLAIRNTFEGIWKHSDYVSPAQRGYIEEYLFKLERNHSNYDVNANEKFVPEKTAVKNGNVLRVPLEKEELFEIARIADDAAKTKGIETRFEQEVRSLERAILDKDHQKNYKAAAGEDKISGSGANYYGVGVTQKDLEALSPQQRDHFLSYPAFDSKGNLKLHLHRIGGRFELQFRVIDGYMKEAMQYATPKEKAILMAYRRLMRTADLEDVKKAEILWVQNEATDLETRLGFIEWYRDPHGMRGAWEGFIYMMNQDPESLAIVDAIRTHFNELEADMPVPNEFKKPAGSVAPKAQGAHLVFSGGDAGEKPPAGKNLPNSAEIQQAHGSKSYTLINVMTEIGGEKGPGRFNQLKPFYLNRYHALLEKFDLERLSFIQVNLHELRGHGSGRSQEGVKDEDLKDYFNPLEEGRAEVASLYHMMNPKLRDWGVLPKTMTDQEFREFSEINLVYFFTNQLKSYADLSDTTQEIKQAHQWARQVMLNRMIEDGALRVVESGEKTPQVEVMSLEAAQRSLGRIWHDFQVIKSTGDYAAATRLFDSKGVYGDLHKAWRVEINKLYEKLHMPKRSGVAYLNPAFQLMTDAEGNAIDVKLVYSTGRGRLGELLERQVELSQRNEARYRACEAALEHGQL